MSTLGVNQQFPKIGPPIQLFRGKVWSIILCVSRGNDRALLGLLGGEAEETGHSEREERGDVKVEVYEHASTDPR